MFNDDDFDGYDDDGYDPADDMYAGTAIDGPVDDESADDPYDNSNVEVTGAEEEEGEDVDSFVDDDPYDNRYME